MSSLLIETLENLGFSNYEARAYVGLQKQYPVSGYQLSKNTQIPRSRIYEILDRLVKKGYATRYQTDPVEFIPLSPRGLVARLKTEFNGSLLAFESYAKTIPLAESAEDILYLRGHQAITEWIVRILREAQESVFLSTSASLDKRIHKELAAVAKRNVKIITHMNEAVTAAYTGIHYYRNVAEQFDENKEQVIHLVVDCKQVLMGDIGTQESMRVIWSRKPHLVSMAIHYIILLVAREKFYAQFGERASNILDVVNDEFSRERVFQEQSSPQVKPLSSFLLSQSVFGMKLKTAMIEPPI